MNGYARFYVFGWIVIICTQTHTQSTLVYFYIFGLFPSTLIHLIHFNDALRVEFCVKSGFIDNYITFLM